MGLEALPRAGGDGPVALKRGGWRSHGGGGHIPERAVRRWELIWPGKVLGEGESCTCWGWGGFGIVGGSGGGGLGCCQDLTSSENSPGVRGESVPGSGCGSWCFQPLGTAPR